MQYTNKLAPRSAASWVAWRAVASLAARGRAFAWRQSIGGGGAATFDSGAQSADGILDASSPGQPRPG
jgi:hypothetical protein